MDEIKEIGCMEPIRFETFEEAKVYLKVKYRAGWRSFIVYDKKASEMYRNEVHNWHHTGLAEMVSFPDGQQMRLVRLNVVFLMMAIINEDREIEKKVGINDILQLGLHEDGLFFTAPDNTDVLDDVNALVEDIQFGDVIRAKTMAEVFRQINPDLVHISIRPVGGNQP